MAPVNLVLCLFFFLFLFLTVKNSFRSWTWSMIFAQETQYERSQMSSKDSHQHNSTWQTLLMSSFKIIENYFFFRFRWRFNLENHILRRVKYLLVNVIQLVNEEDGEVESSSSNMLTLFSGPKYWWSFRSNTLWLEELSRNGTSIHYVIILL